jgi:hypothetical protein
VKKPVKPRRPAALPEVKFRFRHESPGLEGNGS